MLHALGEGADRQPSRPTRADSSSAAATIAARVSSPLRIVPGVALHTGEASHNQRAKFSNDRTILGLHPCCQTENGRTAGF
jgi:hypothetical protein